MPRVFEWPGLQWEQNNDYYARADIMGFEEDYLVGADIRQEGHEWRWAIFAEAPDPYGGGDIETYDLAYGRTATIEEAKLVCESTALKHLLQSGILREIPEAKVTFSTCGECCCGDEVKDTEPENS